MTYFPEKPYNVAVIGAASGIGKAAAQFLAREGARVFCIDRYFDGAEAAALEIGSLASAAAPVMPSPGFILGRRVISSTRVPCVARSTSSSAGSS